MNDMHEAIKGTGKTEKAGRRSPVAARNLDEAEVIADDITGKIRAAADDAGQRAKRYAEATVDFVKENPFYIALGVAALGAAAGAVFLSRQNKPRSRSRKG